MEAKTSTPFLSRFLKIFMVALIGIVLIVCASIGLRKICCVKQISQASAPAYLLILSPTDLYLTNTLENKIITLPEGYYAEIISSSNSIVRVSYNGITGFISNDEKIEKLTTKPTLSLYESAEIVTRSDAGTHLREQASTLSNKIALVPQNTPLTYLGEINTETPTDGTTPTWFYVHYNSGATTTHTGYIYSERVIVLSGKEKRTATPSLSTTPITQDNTDTKESTNQPLLAKTTISSGLKIFLVILFSSLGVIIFALLLISPKGEKKHRKKKESPPNSPKPLPLSAINQPEFADFIDFTQPKNENIKQTDTLPSKIHTEKKELSLYSHNKNSAPLPKSLARYFKAERTLPPDDELL